MMIAIYIYKTTNVEYGDSSKKIVLLKLFGLLLNTHVNNYAKLL